MKLLDLCCCAGGAAMGYHRAGFDVLGVDIMPQPRFPFAFIQADAFEYMANHGHEYDMIHVSPPCQGYSPTRNMHSNEYPLLIERFRCALQAIGKPYVIENVEGAKRHMVNPLMLCGSMFGLPLRRHRLFETNPVIWFAPATCQHWGRTAKKGEYDKGQHGFITVAGHNFNLQVASKAMGIDWMNHDEIAEAIPPVFTEFVGREIMKQLIAQ